MTETPAPDPPRYTDAASQRRLRTLGIQAYRDDGWLLAGEAAARINVNKATLHRWAKAGRLRFVHTANGYRLYWPADLDREAAANQEASVVEPGTTAT